MRRLWLAYDDEGSCHHLTADLRRTPSGGGEVPHLHAVLGDEGQEALHAKFRRGTSPGTIGPKKEYV